MINTNNIEESLTDFLLPDKAGGSESDPPSSWPPRGDATVKEK